MGRLCDHTELNGTELGRNSMEIYMYIYVILNFNPLI